MTSDKKKEHKKKKYHNNWNAPPQFIFPQTTKKFQNDMQFKNE